MTHNVERMLNMYKAVLEIENKRQNKSFAEYEEVFCQYDIDGTKVVFVQSLECGGIYGVEVRKSNKSKTAIKGMYVVCNFFNETQYPVEVEIDTSGRCYLNDVEQYIENVQYAKEIAQAIMDIFAEGKHWELYQKMKG